jgi:hypothetical protein
MDITSMRNCIENDRTGRASSISAWHLKKLWTKLYEQALYDVLFL